jgi:hypothetical protein
MSKGIGEDWVIVSRSDKRMFGSCGGVGGLESVGLRIINRRSAFSTRLLVASRTETLTLGKAHA